MGLFDRFRGEQKAGPSSGAVARPAPQTVLDDIIKAYGLRETKPYEPSIEGIWWEGAAGVTRFAVQEHAGRLFVHIGTIDEMTDIYLGRATDKLPLPPEQSPSRIDRIVREHPICRQFFLLAHPHEVFDHPLLRQPGVAEALGRLSDLVAEVMLYEQNQGVTLMLMGAITLADFDRDLATGVELLKAVEKQ